MDWREHPRLTLTGLLLVIVALLFLLVRSCGCGRSSAPAVAQSAEAAAGKAKAEPLNASTGRPKKVWTDDCPEPPNWGKEDETPKPAAPATPPVAPQAKPVADGGNDIEGASPKRVEKPIRPKDVADWKRDDFYSAKRDGDPRLLDAVVWLGERFAGKEPAAELLTRLLESGADDPFAKSAPQGPSAPDPKLTEAIVAALAANGTPLAQQTLERLVAGKLETSDKQAAAAAALKGLAARPGRDGEDAIFRAVTAPRPAGTTNQTQSDTPELRAITMELIKSTASEALRLRLARHATEPGTPQTLFDELWNCLHEPRPENLAAQIVFYQSNRLDEKAVELLEEQFMLQSMAVLGRLLGFASRRDRQVAADAGAAATVPDRAAELLWADDFTAVVAARLRTVEGLTQGGRLLRLAASIPSQPMRVAMRQTLDKYWEEGPRGLDALFPADGGPQEPGFLLVVKKLPRKDPPSGRSAMSARAAASESKRRQDEVAQQWMAFSENLVRATCQRFCTAALTPSPGHKRTDVDVADLPLKPNPNAEIAASYRVNWPETLSGKLAVSAVSPLRVRYLRIEQKARPVRLLAYYRAQLTNCSEHSNQYGYWLDAFTTDKQRAAARSVDVLITKRNKDIPTVPNEEQQLIVEILFVEVESANRDSRNAVSSHAN